MLTIQTLELQNFRGIEKMILPLEPKLTVIAGINGIGKTTIVDALALLFSWLTARTKRDSGNGRSIDERDIKHGAKYAELSIATSAGKWSLAKSRKGVIESKKSDLTNLRDIVYSLRKKLDQETALPVFACYPVERAVVRIPLRIRTKHNFDPVSIYDESLIGRTYFSLFFEWFREREDIENENFRTKDQNGYPDSQLQAVRQALEKFLPEYRSFRIKRQPLRMVVIKDGEELKIDDLSAGEKSFIALIGDIARRLAIANPFEENPLDGEGVVLIDEIDLHLHPSWQRRAITKLKLQEVFPNVQFVVTTHSPQVLSEVSPESIRLLYRENEIIHYVQPCQSYGLDSSQILRELMDDPGINSEVSHKLDIIAETIDQDDFKAARILIERLKTELKGSIPALVEAESTIAMLEPDNGMQE